MSLGFEALVWLWIATGAVTFLVLLKVPAPYGRHASTKWDRRWTTGSAGW